MWYFRVQDLNRRPPFYMREEQRSIVNAKANMYMLA